MKLMMDQKLLLTLILFLSKQNFLLGQYVLTNQHLKSITHKINNATTNLITDFLPQGFPMGESGNCLTLPSSVLEAELKRNFFISKAEIIIPNPTELITTRVEVLDVHGKVVQCQPQCLPNISNMVRVVLTNRETDLCQIKIYVSLLVTREIEIALTTVKPDKEKPKALPIIVYSLIGVVVFLLLITTCLLAAIIHRLTGHISSRFPSNQTMSIPSQSIYSAKNNEISINDKIMDDLFGKPKRKKSAKKVAL